jgi:hemerythrin
MIGIPWSDRFSLHDEALDAQHRSLLMVINRLAGWQAHHRADPPLAALLSELEQLARHHFQQEEDLLITGCHPGTRRHMAEHAAFLDTLAAFRHEAAHPVADLMPRILDCLNHWFLDHMLVEDQDLRPLADKARAMAEARAVL